MANRVSTVGVSIVQILSMSQSLLWHLTAHVKQYKLKLAKLVLECLHHECLQHDVSVVKECVMMLGD